MSPGKVVAAAVLALAAVIACSPASSGSQYDYTYENCERGGILCPNDQTITCALHTIADRHDSCARDEDCVVPDVSDDCVGILGCYGPPPVNQSEKSAFETEFKAELGKYCATATCTSKTTCAAGDKNVISCFEGACTRSFRPLDSGFPDAGVFIPFDGGSGDAGVDGGTDAGVDAGFDAGFDAGVDAGFDGGEDAGADAGDGGP